MSSIDGKFPGQNVKLISNLNVVDIEYLELTSSTYHRLKNCPCQSFIIQADHDNVDTIYLGIDDTVAEDNSGHSLDPGESVSLLLVNTNLIWLKGDVADIVRIFISKRDN